MRPLQDGTVSEIKQSAPRAGVEHGDCAHQDVRQFNYYNLGKEFWAINKLNIDLRETYHHCLACTHHTCMKSCPQHLFIPEEIERIYRLVDGFGRV